MQMPLAVSHRCPPAFFAFSEGFFAPIFPAQCSSAYASASLAESLVPTFGLNFSDSLLAGSAKSLIFISINYEKNAGKDLFGSLVANFCISNSR